MLALTLVGPMTSCSDFLDEELTTQQNTDFFDTQEGIDRLEVSLYYNLRFHLQKSGHVPLLTMVRMSFV